MLFRTSLVVFVCSLCAVGAGWGRELVADEPLHQTIDRLIAEPWAKQKIVASGVANDEEFLRRVSLDLTGNVPTADEVRAFLKDGMADKRERLIDRLLASEQFAAHMAVVFDVVLMERRPDKHVPTADWRNYLKTAFRENRPLDQLVRDLLDSDGTNPATRPAAKFVMDREVATDVLVRDLGRLLLGIDLQCAQCHDHPSVTDYRHEHYYGLQAFIAGIKLFKQADGQSVLQENVVREVSFASVFEPSKSKKTGPRLPGGEMVAIPEFKAGDEYVEKPSAKVRAVPKFSLRHALAESLPRAETSAFARNFANRLWAHVMGIGLVQPLDMHHGENPPSHPELLATLSEKLVAMKFDQRQFLRELMLSETYQRSSLAPEGVAADELPPTSYAIANLKGIGPEQLFDCLVRATENEDNLRQQIDETLSAKPAAEREKWTADPSLRKKAFDDELAKRIDEFADLFGGTAGSPDPDFQPTLPQALFLANGSAITSWLAPQHENLTVRLLKLDDPQRVADELYYRVLGRGPLPEEIELVREHLKNPPDRTRAMQELVWSLVASIEFRLNH